MFWILYREGKLHFSIVQYKEIKIDIYDWLKSHAY